MLINTISTITEVIVEVIFLIFVLSSLDLLSIRELSTVHRLVDQSVMHSIFPN